MSAAEASAEQSPAARAQWHGEFLRKWEKSALLTEAQLDLCSQIEHAVANPWAPAAPTSSEDTLNDRSDAKAAPQSFSPSTSQIELVGVEDDLDGLGRVRTAEDFRSWYETMERRLAMANEEKYRDMVQGLRDHETAVADMAETTIHLEAKLDSIVNERANIFQTTDAFRADCENLVSERKRLGELADALRRRLKYFEELETLSNKFGSGRDGISPTNPDFVKNLHRLDECIAYASSSTGAVAEADGYLARFLELQRRAFTLIRDFTIQTLRSTAAQVATELKSEKSEGKMVRETELTDASKEYLRFRTVAPKVKSLLAELQSRSGPGLQAQAGPGPVDPVRLTRNAAVSLLGDCEECFVEQRRRLLEASVIAHVKSLGEVQNTIALARAGANYILQLCQMERSLYEHFFPVDLSQDECPSLMAELRMFCSIYHEELRPRVLKENDLDKLVYLIEVLKMEVLADEVPRKGIAGEALANSIGRCIADTQERIIFRAEVFIRDEVRGFVPLPECLNYPDIITDASAREAATAALAATRRKSRRGEPGDPDQEAGMVGLYATWYPPVERTLRLLSMLYRCVDRQVFAGIAQEAVSICVQGVVTAKLKIALSKRPNAEEHAQLFLVWQLLMLREQISPFDVEFAYTEKELDFIELRSLLGNVIRGQVTVRALAVPPAVREKLIDSKRELEREVRVACEDFILKTTRVFLDPILAFLAKCNALPVPENRGGSNQSESESAFDKLKSTRGSFAAPESVADMWQKVSEAINDRLSVIIKRMRLYITKQSSCAVLTRPVKANFAEAASELLSALQTRYTLEERERIGIDGDSVESLLSVIDGILSFNDLGK